MDVFRAGAPGLDEPDTEWAAPGLLYTGGGGTGSMERWWFWVRRFEELSKSLPVGDRAREVAEGAWREMREIGEMHGNGEI